MQAALKSKKRLPFDYPEMAFNVDLLPGVESMISLVDQLNQAADNLDDLRDELEEEKKKK